MSESGGPSPMDRDSPSRPSSMGRAVSGDSGSGSGRPVSTPAPVTPSSPSRFMRPSSISKARSIFFKESESGSKERSILGSPSTTPGRLLRRTNTAAPRLNTGKKEREGSSEEEPPGKAQLAFIKSTKKGKLDDAQVIYVDDIPQLPDPSEVQVMQHRRRVRVKKVKSKKKKKKKKEEVAGEGDAAEKEKRARDAARELMRSSSRSSRLSMTQQSYRRKIRNGKVLDPENPNDQTEFLLTCGMMLGLRAAVGRQENPLEDKTLQIEDFFLVDKYVFPPSGSVSGPLRTPSHKLGHTFKFKDYAAKVFKRIREHFGVDRMKYMLSVAGEYNFLEFISNAKSGEFFFFSHDERFMIKTMKKSEVKFLRRILPHYYEHVKNNPDTFLVRFYGMYRVKMHHIHRQVHFIVMNSVLDTNKEIHSTFDLKGSTYGRVAKPSEKVKKDQDLMASGRKLHLGPQRANFLEVMRKDADFLASMNIMDYSLLLGIHDRTVPKETTPSPRRYSKLYNWADERDGEPRTGGKGGVGGDSSRDGAGEVKLDSAQLRTVEEAGEEEEAEEEEDDEEEEEGEDEEEEEEDDEEEEEEEEDEVEESGNSLTLSEPPPGITPTLGNTGFSSTDGYETGSDEDEGIELSISDFAFGGPEAPEEGANGANARPRGGMKGGGGGGGGGGSGSSTGGTVSNAYGESLASSSRSNGVGHTQTGSNLMVALESAAAEESDWQGLGEGSGPGNRRRRRSVTNGVVRERGSKISRRHDQGLESFRMTESSVELSALQSRRPPQGSDGDGPGEDTADGEVGEDEEGALLAADQIRWKKGHEIYFCGVIDILQDYKVRKRGETMAKSMMHSKAAISCVDPHFYAQRFIHFLEEHTD